MAAIRRNGHWIIAVIGMVTSAWAVTVLAQRQPALAAPGAAPAAVAPANVPAAGDAKGLSAIFRNVSREVLPGIVSVETKGRPVRVRGRRGREPEGTPLEAAFRRMETDRKQEAETTRARGARDAPDGALWRICDGEKVRPLTQKVNLPTPEQQQPAAAETFALEK